MEINLIEQLLNESESAYLDFKREQYPFDGADDDVKSELLKDILAFTNAWRRTDAYILIGVQEIKGGMSKIVGITKHLEDHFLQQFVNSKTQQPITLSYISMTFDGQQIGVIKIPVQSRPIYLKKDYGKLKKNVVYIRRGSSTDEASPDEIAKMGAAEIGSLTKAEVNVEFANLKSQGLIGRSIVIESKALNLATEQIPDFVEKASNSSNPLSPLMNLSVGQPNKRYYKELVNYFDEKFLLKPIGFAVKNLGQSTIHNVRMTISIEKWSDLKLLVADEFSERPKKYSNFFLEANTVNIPVSMSQRSNLSLETYDEKQVVNIEYGNLQPKVIGWSDEAIFIGARNKEKLDLECHIFADELSEPATFRLTINFEPEVLTLKLGDLEKMLKKEFSRLFDELDH